MGINKFVLQADAPDISQIPQDDILGVTVVLVTCSYREKEFVRVGYYVNNEYTEPYDEEVGPPKPLDMSKVRRVVLADKPRVTRFPVQWGDKEESTEQKTEEEGNNNSSAALQDGASMLEEANGKAAGMTLDDEMDDDGTGDTDDAVEFEEEEEEDDVSVEGKDMMMEDVGTSQATAGSSEVSPTVTME